MSKPTFTLTIAIDQSRVRRGHQPHRSGAGTHQHRTTKRHRTRSAIRRAALKSWD